MKTKIIIMTVFILCWLPSALLMAQADESQSFLEQYKMGVITYQTYGEDKVEIARGTGFLFDREMMITAYHLVSEIASAEGQDHRGKKVKVEGIIAVNKDFDLALLKVKSKEMVMGLGDSDTLESGKKVFTIGVDENGEIMAAEGAIKDFLALSPTKRVVTSSLDIPDTFCGAPLLDSEGKVLGVIVFLDRRSKFIVPGNILKSLSKTAKATKFKDWKVEDYFTTIEGATLAGYVYAKLDETAKASTFLVKVTELNPANIDAFDLLSAVYAEARNYSAAIPVYEKVIELDEGWDKAHYGLGYVKLMMRKYEEAILSLQKSVDLNPKNNIAYYHIGTAYEELKDFAKAADAYQKYVDGGPIDPRNGYFRLGLCGMELEDYDRAIAAFLKAREFDPRDIKTNFNLAQAYQKAGQLENAETTYAHMAELNPEEANIYYSTILRMYDQAGVADKAIDAARKLIELDPNSEINVYNLGLMFMKLERYDEAIQTFQEVLGINPEYDRAYFNIGVCYSQQKKYPESIEAFEKFVELSPDNADGWHYVGMGYMLNKKFARAVEPLQKAVELRPEFAPAYYNLAITYLNLKDNFSAREIHKKLLTLDAALAAKLQKLLR